MHLKPGVTDPEYVALVEFVNKLYAEEAQRKKHPENRKQMKATDGQICIFTEP